jgi:ATP-dependent Clp protease protease subunit
MEMLAERILFLTGEINSEAADGVVQRLIYFNAIDPQKAVDLYINSPGGSVPDGLAIVDTMQCIQAPIRTICLGTAASMAAWILAAGSKGERYASPNSKIMIHQMASGFRGSTSNIRAYAKHLFELQDNLIRLFASFTGQPFAKIQADIEVDLFLTPLEAKSYGIIDHVYEYHK